MSDTVIWISSLHNEVRGENSIYRKAEEHSVAANYCPSEDKKCGTHNAILL